jgi:hypothetical protein
MGWDDKTTRNKTMNEMKTLEENKFNRFVICSAVCVILE